MSFICLFWACTCNKSLLSHSYPFYTHKNDYRPYLVDVAFLVCLILFVFVVFFKLLSNGYFPPSWNLNPILNIIRQLKPIVKIWGKIGILPSILVEIAYQMFWNTVCWKKFQSVKNTTKKLLLGQNDWNIPKTCMTWTWSSDEKSC